MKKAKRQKQLKKHKAKVKISQVLMSNGGHVRASCTKLSKEQIDKVTADRIIKKLPPRKPKEKGLYEWIKPTISSINTSRKGIYKPFSKR